MNILVVGCGAMGAIFAGLLAKSGNTVSVLVRNAQNAALINQQGLRVEGASGDTTQAVHAITTSDAADGFDLVILAVKATQIDAAAKDARRYVGDRTRILTIQNGLGSAEIVAGILGHQRLMVGIAGGFGAELKSARHTFHNNMQVVRIGAYADLPWRDVEEVVAGWQQAGFKTEASAKIEVMLWEKLICNVAYSAPCAISGMTTGQVMDDPDIGPISRAAAQEAWDIAIASGIELTVLDPIAHVRAFAGGMPASRPSLLQDVEQGRASEIDFINGAIPREAFNIGKQAPVNANLTALVRAIERRKGSR
ncbi:MAG: ketopantoate reductase family protein [Flavobacteriaceae bacterium]|nr:ketopantoate reductase family protein [Flavobacteriaceae bacterium]